MHAHANVRRLHRARKNDTLVASAPGTERSFSEPRRTRVTPVHFYINQFINRPFLFSPIALADLERVLKLPRK